MTGSNKGDYSGMEGEDMELDAPTVTLTDEHGRSLSCYVEHSLEVDEQEYVLLLPVDAPVEIFVWEGDEEEEEPIPVEEEAEINKLFPIAKSVLEEQNLTLKRTAITLTVAGDLPDVDEEEVDLEDEEADIEELQLLASFYYEEQEYTVYTPLDPFFILARIDSAGQPQLLSPEEFQKIEPMLASLEDQLFDALD